MTNVLLSLFLSLVLASPGWAAIAFDSVVESPETAHDATGATAVTDTWSLASGRFVAVCVQTTETGTTLNSVTDTAGNTYTDSGAGRVDAPVGSGSTWLYYAYNTTANASNAVTATWSASVTAPSVIAATYSGVQTSSDPKDTGNTGTATDTTSVTSGSFTPSTAGQVAIACTGEWPTNTDVTPDGNYTERNEWINTNGSSVHTHLQDRLNAPTASQTASASWTNNSWAAMIVYTFKEASTGRRPVAPLFLSWLMSLLTPFGGAEVYAAQ